MCGLYGFITNKTKYKSMTNRKRDKIALIAASLSLAMQERGTDSTGIATFDGENNGSIFRRTRPANQVVHKVLGILSNKKQMLIGHTRTATVGAVVKDNAHPFRKGGVIGAHNGSVFNWRTLDSTVSVDSEVIFNLLDKEKNDFAVFDKLNGRFAITWNYADDKNCVFLVRHKNPLFLVHVPVLNSYFWCSTQPALESALLASLGPSVLRSLNIIDLQEDVVYKIGGTLRMSKSNVTFREYATTAASTPYTPYSGREYGYSSPKTIFRSDVDAPALPACIEHSRESSFARATKSRVVKELQKEIIVPQKAFVGKEKTAFHAIFNGCYKCGADLDDDSSLGAYWDEKEGAFLCMQCCNSRTDNWENALWFSWRELENFVNSMDTQIV